MRIRVRKAVPICLFLAITLGASQASAALGDSPLVNTIQGTSNINLNFSSSGTHQQIGIFVISSNDPAGFHVTFTFANKGAFKVGTRSFTMTNLVLNKISGTLGGGLTEPANDPIVLDGSGSWTWSPGVPSSETDAYLVEIDANWPDPSSGIAGFYLERITCTIAHGP